MTKPAAQLDGDALARQLRDPDQAVRLATVGLLRKQALKGAEFAPLAPELLSLLKSGEPELKSLILKLADNILKGRYGQGVGKPDGMIGLQMSLYRQALTDPLAMIRKAGIYGIHTLLYCYHETHGSTWLHAPEVLADIAPLICDSGCNRDVDNHDWPQTPKGTLTIAEMAVRTLFEFPRTADYAPVFHALIPALEEMHFFLAEGLLDQAYGSKLVDHVVNLFDSLIRGRELPFPSTSYPEMYPNWLAELLVFCNDSTYHQISDLAIYRLKRSLVRSKRHTGELVKLLEIESWEQVKITVLYLLAEKLEAGESLKWCLPRIQAARDQDLLTDLPVPELLRQQLERSLESQ